MRIDEPKTPWHGSPASSDLEEEDESHGSSLAAATPQPSPERGVVPGKAADPAQVAVRLA